MALIEMSKFNFRVTDQRLDNWVEAIVQGSLIPDCHAGVSHRNGQLELIETDSAAAESVLVNVGVGETTLLKEHYNTNYAAHLAFSGQGQIAGFARSSGQWLKLDEVIVVDRFQVIGESSAGKDGSVEHRYSRQAGALGDPVHRQIQSMRHVIVGCGRTGSILATTLARCGVRHMTLIDDDLIEYHNLDMASVTELDVGESKVRAVRRNLALVNSECRVDAISLSASAVSGMFKLKHADVIWTAVDDDRGRITAGMIAAFFRIPLIDIGVSVSRQMNRRTAGFDVRLIQPDRCLMCTGGVTRPRSAFELLGLPIREMTWDEQRAGSLHSLNQIAVHRAVRIYEDAVAGLIRGSRWEQWTDENGEMSMALVALPRSQTKDCLCHLLGIGDQGIRDMNQHIPMPDISREKP